MKGFIVPDFASGIAEIEAGKSFLHGEKVAFGLVDLLYTVTAYRPSRDKTVNLYVYGYVNESALTEYMDNVRQAEMPDMASFLPASPAS